MPTFLEYASAWYARRLGEVAEGEISEATAATWLWGIEVHLLHHFGSTPLDEISVRMIQEYTDAKLAARAKRREAIKRWQADPKREGAKPSPGLSNASIERTVRLLAQILDDAVDAELIPRNPARARRRKLKSKRPTRRWLELAQVRALVESADKHAAMIGVMLLGGLRVSEACALQWSDIDLAGGRIFVRRGKTAAATRTVDMTGWLRDLLAEHRTAQPGDLVFATRFGNAWERSNVHRIALRPAVRRADALLAEQGEQPIGHVGCHDLRRTYASLLYESDATPAYAMNQMGHESSALALDIYAQVMECKNRDTSGRLDALLRGPSAGAAQRPEAPTNGSFGPTTSPLAQTD